MSFLAAGIAAAIAALALVVRLLIHWGREPGGIDTWYHLAFARGVRAQRTLRPALPQYRLQDLRQSYPPLFPLLLALLPPRRLERLYWLVAPLLDCAHLLLLYGVSLRLTAEPVVAGFAALVYALTPHLVSETRSLNARSFAALVHTVAVLLTLKATLLAPSPGWLVLAAAAGGALLLASATASVAFALLLVVLAVTFAQPHFLAIGAGAATIARWP